MFGHGSRDGEFPLTQPLLQQEDLDQCGVDFRVSYGTRRCLQRCRDRMDRRAALPDESSFLFSSAGGGHNRQTARSIVQHQYQHQLQHHHQYQHQYQDQYQLQYHHQYQDQDQHHHQYQDQHLFQHQDQYQLQHHHQYQDQHHHHYQDQHHHQYQDQHQLQHQDQYQLQLQHQRQMLGSNSIDSNFPLRGAGHVSQVADRPDFYIQEKDTSSRDRTPDLKVFDFVDSTKQLIQKGWNSKLFRRHKLATYNWSFRAPLPLMDSKYFWQVAVKDVLEPGCFRSSALIAGRSMFTPKYGMTARDALRESAGILFFTKDIDFDYQASLKLLNHLHPSLMSSRHYVPFFTFVRALRRARVERQAPRSVDTRTLVTCLLWLLLVCLLLVFTLLMGQDTEKIGQVKGNRKFVLVTMIMAPALSFVLGFCS